MNRMFHGWLDHALASARRPWSERRVCTPPGAGLGLGVWSVVLLLGVFGLLVRADSVVVFNEIMYHPVANESALEWIELHNQNAVDVDLSAWRLSDGIDYIFPEGTVIAGGADLVIASQPAALMAQTGLSNVLGPFSGRLANEGERIQLRDRNNRVMDEISYGTDGEWPAGADGSGVSLAKKHPNLASRPAENWTVSSQAGGTPGRANFPFVAQSAASGIPAPALPLRFNEVSAGSGTGFWIEIINYGEMPVGLDGVEIYSSAGSFRFGSQTMSPGLITLTQAQLGWGVPAGDKIFMATTGRLSLLDAVSVKTMARGRFPDGLGDWMYPSQPTPGASNVVQLHREIVINEIMFHAPPLDPVPPVTSNVTLVPITGVWRYHDAGIDLGTAWRAPGYDDGVWPSGPGLFACNTAMLPAPLSTALALNQATYYFRTRFNFDGPTNNVTLTLRPVVDDGAVFYLNGVEVCRLNMPDGPVVYSTPAAGPVDDATYAEPVILPASLLAPGPNVLAVEVHQAASTDLSSGIVLSGGGLRLVEEGPFGGTPPMNLARQPGAAPFAIDSLAGYPIHNYTGLTDGLYGNANSWIGNSGSPGYAGVRFGGRFTVNGIAFGRDNLGTYTDRTLGTYTLQYTRVVTPDVSTVDTGNPETGWATIGTITYQSAGTGLFTAPSRRHRFTFAPVAATGIRLLVPGTGMGAGTCIDELEVNPPDTSGDVVFGAEIGLITTLAASAPYRTSDEQWVELLNRATEPVDLTGWRLDGGIDFRFTNGPVIPPNGYLVVARDAVALRAKWPEHAASILGDFAGRLQGGERFLLRDAAGNPVDETRVFEGGWSDGGGSTLELRDPGADHLNPAAWADSDESGKGSWEWVSYRMLAGQKYGPMRWNEFRIGLLDQGMVLLDDVSVVRDPDGVREELIQNGNFETITGQTHWRFLGHHRGEFVPDPDQPGNHVLRLSADDRAVMNHNHVETTFRKNTPILDGQLYEVRFRGRWLAGSPQVNTRAYFSKLAKTTVLPMPSRLGTPAAPNSRRVLNAGPTLSGLQHWPIVPLPNQTVTVSVRADDPDGVASVLVKYRINPATAFTTLPMTPQSTGTWAATLPGLAAGKIVQFYVTASDTRGTAASAPAKGPDSRALYQVADGQGTTLPTHELRLIMLDADRDFMFHPTNVMSNARLGATLIYDRAEVFYDAGARLQGTVASRIRDGDDYVSYDIAFPPGQRFRGVQDNIGIDRSGRSPRPRGQDEIYLFQMFHRAGIPVPYHDLCYFISPRPGHTGTAILQLAGYGKRFVEEQYGQAGSVFNMDIIYEPDTTITPSDPESVKLPVPHQPHISTELFTDLGDQEQYRSPFDIRLGNRRDDYAGLMRLCRVMALPQAQFDAQIAAVLDIDEALRMSALEILCGVGDTYISSSAGLPHNLRIITFPGGAPAQFLPWDMDFVFHAATSSSIFITSGWNLGKLMNRPATRRLYLQHIYDLCQTAFTADYLNSWLAHYGRVVGQDFSAASSYIAGRRAFALSQLPPQVPFAITSNGGRDFTASTNVVTLSGSGWLDVRNLEVNSVLAAVSWTTLTNWSVTVPLGAGANVLTVQAVDTAGRRPANRVATIVVTNTAQPAALPVVINEWMASNVGPAGLPDPADGLFQDWFELFNPNSYAVDLGGSYLTDRLSDPRQFLIPPNTVIPARGFLLVWADENVSENSPTDPDLHVNFKLSNEGEALGLFAPDGISPQHTVTFGGQLPNVSEGLFPDGTTGAIFPMPDWTPRLPNRIDPLPTPGIERVVLGTDGALSFDCAASPGRLYEVQFTPDLNAKNWISLGVIRAVGPTLRVTDDPRGSKQRFYRVILLQ